MRLLSFILLSSAAILTCETSSKILVANPLTEVRPESENDSVFPVKRLQGTHDAMKAEDRAPFPLATATVFTDVSKAKENVMNNWKRAWKHQPLVNSLERHGHGANGFVSKAIPEPMTNEGPVAREGSIAKKMSELQERTRAVASKDKLESVGQISAAKKKNKKEQEAKERSLKVEYWMSKGLSIDNVFSLLQLEQDGVDFLRESNLRTLQLFINQYKVKHNTEDTLLQALVRGFSEESSLALMLSVAKEDPSDKLLASTLQTQLMEGWLKHKKSVDSVFSMMNIALEASVADRYLTYTLVDTMDTYIGLFNKAHPAEDRIDAFTYLSTKADDDRVLALLLSEAKAMGHDVSGHELKLHARWLKKGLVPKKIYFYLIPVIGLDHVFFVNRIAADYAAFYKKK